MKIRSSKNMLCLLPVCFSLRFYRPLPRPAFAQTMGLIVYGAFLFYVRNVSLPSIGKLPCESLGQFLQGKPAVNGWKTALSSLINL